MATPRPFRTWHIQLAMFTWIGWHYRDVHWTSSIDETGFDWQFGSACKSYQSAIGTDQQSFPLCHQSLAVELHSMECFPFLCARTCHHAHHGELIDFMGPSACACAFLYAHILASHSKWALQYSLPEPICSMSTSTIHQGNYLMACQKALPAPEPAMVS